MKSKKLQELIKNIFTDEKIRSEFTNDPKSVLSKSSLTDDEKRAILRTHTKFGLITSESAQLQANIRPLVWWF